MKNMRKLFALALAIMMVLSLATTAFADEVEDYEIYQIFTGDISEGKLVNVKWGQNGTGTKGEAVPEETLKALTNVNNDTDTEQLAVIEQYVNLTSTPFTTGPAETYDLPNGYYLVRNAAGSQEGESAFYTLHVVKVVNGSLTIKPKGDAPEVDKAVNDTDVNIGDTVTFTLTATMPSELDGYEKYKVIFHDTLSAGLDYVEDSVKVTVGDADKTTAFTATEKDGTLTISCDDVLAQGATASSQIVVTYEANIDFDAVVGTAGNSNKVKLEYSNNPNTSMEGKTGFTPEVEVKVYTWDMKVLKYADGDETKVLKDVKFILLNEDLSKIALVVGGKLSTWDAYTEGMNVDKYKLATDDLGKISVDGLESGTYYLRETDALPGYNKLTGETTVTVDNNDDGTYTTFVAKVNNQSGATLPETGGVGTTMFYVIGSIMVLAAVVLLVTKKRMAAAE